MSSPTDAATPPSVNLDAVLAPFNVTLARLAASPMNPALGKARRAVVVALLAANMPPADVARMLGMKQDSVRLVGHVRKATVAEARADRDAKPKLTGVPMQAGPGGRREDCASYSRCMSALAKIDARTAHCPAACASYERVELRANGRGRAEGVTWL